MAKEIIWSLKAQDNRKQILEYYRIRNKSSSYSKRLNQLFKEVVSLIAEYPQIGKPSDQSKVRIKIVREYLIIYEESGNKIYILAIWDSRQNPEKLPVK